MNKLLIIVILGVFNANCGSSIMSNSTQAKTATYKEIAVKKLGQGVAYSINDSKTYVLCVSDLKGTAQQPRNSLSYVVIKLKDNSILLEDKFEGGTVSWSGDAEIEVFRTPGIIREDQTRDDFITFYDVESGNSSKKRNTEQH